jgi:hypothetical protein
LKLQSESVDVNLAYVRDLFDGLIELFDDFKQKLSPDAPLVASKDFEKAIVKLQNNMESTLTAAEATAVIHLRKVRDEPSPDDSTGDPLVDILARAENSKRARLEQTQSMYQPVHHILPTSNVVERLFSRAKLIKTDHRKTMTAAAAHLDAVLFLRYNRGRWNEQTIQGLLDEKQAAVIELEEEEEVEEDV